MLRNVMLVTLILCLVPAYGAIAGPVFEDILNTMQIDQSLQRSGDDAKIITKDKSLGQSFVTGDNVIRICRIALLVAYWHEDWKEDETLVCSLWDSPKKKTLLGKFGIPYSQRQWSGNILAFSVEADVQPNTKYYFELTVDGGDGKITGIILSKIGIDYPNGQGYEGSQPSDRNLWFETYVKKTYNKDKLYEEFFDNFNLDYPGLEKVKPAVTAKDWETACKEFLTYMESKTDIMPDEDATPKPDPTVDTREADLAADQKFPAIDGSIVDLGPNWNYHATWPTRGGVGLTRTGLMKPLAFTYTKTGDEKYARAWNDMLISMFRNVPCPFKSGVFGPTEVKVRPTVNAGISNSLWSSISIAARMHHETFYNRFRKSPLFEPDVRMAWWLNLTEMVNTLTRMEAGGNWTTQNTTSLFGFAQKYPEFKKSKQWFSDGFEGLKQNFMDNMYPDGPCKEATTGYHGFSLGMFFNTIQKGRELGLEVPKEILERLENAYAYSMYITQPDWMTPIWGDANRPMDAAGLIGVGAKYFNRDDMLWVSTRGKEGKKPSKASLEFPHAGYYIMRSAWEPAAKFLMTRNGFSQSHYHKDQLSVIVNAYGTDLLPDPGIYAYGTPECNILMQTKSHSTVCVDGKDILPGQGINKWYTNPGFDYYDGISPGYKELEGVTHQRSILFMKPDYWVVADRVTGPGEHTAVQTWRFAPGKVILDDNTGAAKTTNTKGGNIAVIPLYAEGRKNELIKDIYAISWEQVLHDAPAVKYERTGALPKAFCTVLFPYPVGKTINIKAEDLICDDSSLSISVLGAKVIRKQSTDYIVFNASNKMVGLNKAKLQVAAESAYVSTSITNKINEFGWYNGTQLFCDKMILASSKTPVKSLRVKYSGDALIIDAEGQLDSLSIPTMGAKRAIVNGKEIKLVKGAKTFYPFK